MAVWKCTQIFLKKGVYEDMVLSLIIRVTKTAAILGETDPAVLSLNTVHSVNAAFLADSYIKNLILFGRAPSKSACINLEDSSMI